MGSRKKGGSVRSMLSKDLFQSLGGPSDFLPSPPPRKIARVKAKEIPQSEQSKKKKKAPVVPSSSSSSSSSTKRVTLQNYLNILRLIDGLKYQLPMVGEELHCREFVNFMGRNADVLSRRADATSVLSMTGLVGDFVESVSISWNNIVQDYAYPLVALAHCLSSSSLSSLSSSASTTTTTTGFEHSLSAKQRSSVLTRLRCGLQINQPLRRLDKILATDLPERVDPESDEDATVTTGNRQNLSKFLAELRKRYTRDVQADFENTLYSSMISGCLTLSSACACCFYSPCLFLYCSSSSGDCSNNTDTVTVDAIRELYQTYRLPCVLFDAAIVLCDQLNESQFRQDFCLVHLTANADTHGDTFSHVAKSRQVLRMGFYKRLYVMHMLVSVLVNWLWTMQRSQHVSLVNSETLLDVPPVNVIVARNMIDLLRSVDTIPLLLLEKMRKIVIHVA